MTALAPRPTLRLERKCWKAGERLVVGIDEVGRGAWAGPVTVAAVPLTKLGMLPVTPTGASVTVAVMEGEGMEIAPAAATR